MLVIEVIPYKGFKEKIRLTKLYKNFRVTVYENYIYIERSSKKEVIA